MSLESVLTVTPAQFEQIHKSYGRTKEQIAEDVQLMTDWIQKQPHLPPDEDVVMTERNLKFNKFSVERSKHKADYYYAAKSFAPEYLQNIHPLHPSMQKVFSYGCFVPMPKLCQDFGRIIVSKQLFEDWPDFSSIDYLKNIFMHTEIRAKFDNQTHDIIIFDMTNSSFTNIMSFRPIDATKCYALLILDCESEFEETQASKAAFTANYLVIKKAYSVRIGGIHFLNAPTYAMGLINLVKRLLSEKMANRLHVHATLESLHEHIPKELLPKDYGGNEPPIIELHKNWVTFLESKNDWMLERAELKSNEKLRIGSPLDIEVFGTEGTFRKINVD